ncbi:hypothetical protein U1Q18_008183 [Sarracenia purpurea var. burkii]
MKDQLTTMTLPDSDEFGHQSVPLLSPSDGQTMVVADESKTPALEPSCRPGTVAPRRQSLPAPVQPGGATNAAVEVISGRERLKRHRVEVAGRVWIPDIWGQEELLKDWIDCTAFDASLVNSNIVSARAALAGEGRVRSNSSSGLRRIENRC